MRISSSALAFPAGCGSGETPTVLPGGESRSSLGAHGPWDAQGLGAQGAGSTSPSSQSRAGWLKSIGLLPAVLQLPGFGHWRASPGSETVLPPPSPRTRCLRDLRGRLKGCVPQEGPADLGTSLGLQALNIKQKNGLTAERPEQRGCG